MIKASLSWKRCQFIWFSVRSVMTHKGECGFDWELWIGKHVEGGAVVYCKVTIRTFPCETEKKIRKHLSRIPDPETFSDWVEMTSAQPWDPWIYEDSVLIVCSAVLTGKCLPTCRKSVLPQPSWSVSPKGLQSSSSGLWGRQILLNLCL